MTAFFVAFHNVGKLGNGGQTNLAIGVVFAELCTSFLFSLLALSL